MKISLALIISSSTVLIGLFFGKPLIFPISFLLASVIELSTRNWVNSMRLGSMRNLSITIKSLLALIGFYALVGQAVCIVIIIWWFMFS